ncbi:MAG: hypothetical protein ACOZAO_05895 [Patescibacteria group bacterium]
MDMHVKKHRGLVKKKGQDQKIGVNRTTVKVNGWNGSGSFRIAVRGRISQSSLLRKIGRIIPIDLGPYTDKVPHIE